MNNGKKLDSFFKKLTMYQTEKAPSLLQLLANITLNFKLTSPTGLVSLNLEFDNKEFK